MRKYLQLSGIFILGAIVGGGVMTYAYQRIVLLPRADEVIALAGIDAELASRLRFGEVDAVTRVLEGRMDNAVLGLRAWSESGMTMGGLTDQRIRWLQGVKVYRAAYPSTQPHAKEVQALLASVPTLPRSDDCNSAVCRLEQSVSTTKPSR